MAEFQLCVNKINIILILLSLCSGVHNDKSQAQSVHYPWKMHIYMTVFQLMYYFLSAGCFSLESQDAGSLFYSEAGDVVTDFSAKQIRHGACVQAISR